MQANKRNIKLNPKQGNLFKDSIKMITKGRPTRGRESPDKCQYCDGSYKSRNCTKFETPQKRSTRARERGLYFNCLRDHLLKYCKSKQHCSKCGNQHNISLCIVSPRDTSLSAIQQEATELPISITSEKTVTLMTTEVSLITDKLAKAFDLSGPPVGTMKIAGFNGNISCVPFRDCSIGILNTDGDMGKIKICCVPTIAHSLQVVRVQRDILTPTEIIRKLRAPSLIIGNDLFWTFVTRRLDRFIEGYQLISSSVGPLLSGFIPTANSLTTNLCAHIIVSISDKKVNKQIHDWLALQTIGIKEDPYANEDDAAWTRFKDTYKIEDGRYAVSVPIRDPDAEITSNKGLIRSHEWLKEEIIEKVPHKELDNTNYGFCSYVPFHMITKETPNVTKYRIVHNASARRKNTPSLNDLLYKGPVKLPDVLGTLIRFGQHRIAVTADVKAAFN
uniref:DUF1758 domain-containing protein n=1 Tax=Heterorhabditis bacteriophora TaxID=37862 RepID=A0A1I7XID3_HETBA